MTPEQPRAYFVVGDDPYLIEEAIRDVISGAGDLDVSEFSGRDEVTRIVESLRTASMLGGRRVVVVRDVDEMSAESQRELISYLDEPSPDSVGVFVSKKPIAKVAAAAKKHGHVVEAGRGRRQDVLAWLRTEVKGRGLKSGSDALTRLIESIGEERMALSNAVEELALSLGRGAKLTPDEVGKHFRDRADVKVFGFVDAVANRDAGAALESLHRLLKRGESPQALFWTLARHVRLMISATGSPEQVAQKLGLPQWRAEKVSRQARRFTPNELRAAVSTLAEADRKMKNSEEPEELTLERVVVEISGVTSAAR